MELYPVSLNSHRYIRAPIHFEGGLLIVALLISLAIIAVVFRLPKSEKFNDGLMTANKLFRYEPAVFARFRWIISAKKILRAADKKVGVFLVVDDLTSSSLPHTQILILGTRSPVPSLQRRYRSNCPSHKHDT